MMHLPSLDQEQVLVGATLRVHNRFKAMLDLVELVRERLDFIVGQSLYEWLVDQEGQFFIEVGYPMLVHGMLG
jgi:hypothetical protein